VAHTGGDEEFRTWRAAVLLVVLLLPAATLALLGPIPQSPAYHTFADNRAWFGLPNAADLLSNLPFLLIGAAGLQRCLFRPLAGARRAWLMFFASVMLVCAGSAYYHYAPNDDTLVWDRLPMTLLFMSLFAALVSEFLDARLERWLLLPALLAGAASVVWWRVSGDLRFYLWVQAAPFLAIVVLYVLYRGRYPRREFLVYGFIAYALSKAAEYYDAGLFALTAGALSGHSLKHLLSALAVLFVYFMLRARQPGQAA
jgi:hypothetical protein